LMPKFLMLDGSIMFPAAQPAHPFIINLQFVMRHHLSTHHHASTICNYIYNTHMYNYVYIRMYRYVYI
jgi:hypothetical protein